MDKVLALFGKVGVFVEVPQNGQDLPRALVERHNIGKLDACGLPVRGHILKALDVEVNVHLQKSVRLIEVGLRCALQIVNLFADDVVGFVCGAEFDVPIEPSNLHLADVIFVHPKHVRDTGRRVQVGGGVRDNEVLGRDKLGYGPLQGHVPVDFLEARA